MPVLGRRVVLSYDAKIDEINLSSILLDLAKRNSNNGLKKGPRRREQVSAKCF